MFQFQENEHVIMYVRKHWIWLLLETVKVLLLFIIPVSLVLYLDFYVVDSEALFFGYPVTDLFTIFIYTWAVFCWMFMADRFTKYALNFWVLTNKKLVESEHLMLFSRKLSTLELESIEDATVKFDGPLETILNFGSLTVQTAGTQREFLADDVNDPEGVKLAIFDARQNLKEEDRRVSVENSDELSQAMAREAIDAVFDNKQENVEEDTVIHHTFDLPYDQTLRNKDNQYDWARK